MGLKEIFRKEEKYLSGSRDIPPLASEQLSESLESNNFIEKESPPEPKQAVRNYEISNMDPEIPRPDNSTTSQQQNLNNNQNPQMSLNQNNPQANVMAYPVPNMIHPQFYQPNFVHPMNLPQYAYPYPSHAMPHFAQYQHFPVSNMQSEMNRFYSEEFHTSERGPLRKLLMELDKLEGRWHSLTRQKESLSKEMKYLESEIEHKMRLLRTHLAIANEGNDVGEGDEFYLADGQILKSRDDLFRAAESMTKQIFDHHVGPGWNDFEAWVANCLHDYTLAKKLKEIKSVNELISALKKY